MQVDVLRVRVERGEAFALARLLALADVARAELRLRLDDVHPVALAEQREKVVGVVLVDGERAFLRVPPGQKRRHGNRRRARDGGHVAEPERALRQTREVGKTAGVDVAVRVLERDRRELVEEQEDDRCRVADRRGGGAGLGVREDERVYRRPEQEDREEDGRRRGEDRQEPARGPHAPDGECEADPDRDRAHDQRRRPAEAGPLQRLDAEDRAEGGQEDQVQDESRLATDELDEYLDGEQDESRDEDDDEPEQEDVAGRGAVRGEELGVLAEDVEERLREGEAGDGEQLREAQCGLAQARAPLNSRDPGVSDRHHGSIPRSRDARPVPIRISWRSTSLFRGPKHSHARRRSRPAWFSPGSSPSASPSASRPPSCTPPRSTSRTSTSTRGSRARWPRAAGR